MSTTKGLHCTIYGGHGVATELTVERANHDHEEPYQPPDRTSLGSIMTRDLVCAQPDLEIATVVSLVIGRHVGCIPVVDGRRKPIGVITKFDLVEQLDAAMRGSICGCPLPSDLRVETADDVMMPLALTLYESASIAHAAAMMTNEDTHHVLVVDEHEALIGVVSAKDIVSWVATHDDRANRRGATCGLRQAWHPLEG